VNISCINLSTESNFEKDAVRDEFEKILNLDEKTKKIYLNKSWLTIEYLSDLNAIKMKNFEFFGIKELVKKDEIHDGINYFEVLDESIITQLQKVEKFNSIRYNMIENGNYNISEITEENHTESEKSSKTQTLFSVQSSVTSSGAIEDDDEYIVKEIKHIMTSTYIFFKFLEK
jgi:hypothetical protein